MDIGGSSRVAEPDLDGGDLYRTAFERTPVGLAFLTPDRRVLRTNPALCTMLGYSESELVEMGVDRLTHPEDRGFHRGVHDDLMSGRRATYEMEKRYIHRDGHVVWASLQVGVVTDASGAVTMLVSQVQDVTCRILEQQQTEWRADHDPLTGAANRATLMRELARLTVEGDRRRSSAVLYLDLDGFKALNDGRGHAAGDRYLVSVTERIQQAVRRRDIVARPGGDEFVVIAHDLPGREEARAVGEAIRSAVNHLSAELDGAGVSVSVGIAMSPAASVDDLVARADTAMYAAKRAGGNRVVVDGEV